MKVLLIGGDGFIGSYIFKNINKDKTVTIYDLPNCDILNDITLEKYIYANDLIINLAAIADVSRCQKAHKESFDINVKGAYNVAKYCSLYNKKLIHISSCSVYGNLDCYTDEKTAPLMCNDYYALTKLMGEKTVQSFFGLQYMILRPSTVYGVASKPELFTSIVVDALLHNKAIYIHGDGSQTRKMIFIDDLIKAICICIDNFKSSEVLNICGDEDVSPLDVLNIFYDIINNELEYYFIDQRANQVFTEIFNNETAKNIIGWQPSTGIREGLNKIAVHYGLTNETVNKANGSSV